jgi:hypothetical protein
MMRQHNVQCVGCDLCAEMDEVFLLIKLSVALVRKNLCSLKVIELSKHVGAN